MKKSQTPNTKHQRNRRRPGFWSFFGICFLLFGLSACRSAKPAPEPPVAVARAERAIAQAQGLSEQGNWPAAVTEWRRAADEASLLHDRASEAIALHNLARAESQLEQYTSARSNALAAAELNNKIGRTSDWWRNQILLLQLEALQTNVSPAARIGQLLPRVAEITDAEIRGAFWNEVGLAQLRQSERERASESFLRAQAEYGRADDPAGVATVIANRARLMEAQGRLELATRAWADALQRFERLADPEGIAHALLGHGRTLLARETDLSLARDHLRRAARNFRNLGMEAEAAKADELLARP